MAKKLLIKTPKTVDGRNIEYDEEKRPVYKHTIVELSARRDFQSLNARLPKVLHHIIEEIEVDEENPMKKALQEKDREIENLKKQLAAKNVKEPEGSKEVKDSKDSGKKTSADKGNDPVANPWPEKPAGSDKVPEAGK